MFDFLLKGKKKEEFKSERENVGSVERKGDLKKKRGRSTSISPELYSSTRAILNVVCGCAVIGAYALYGYHLTSFISSW